MFTWKDLRNLRVFESLRFKVGTQLVVEQPGGAVPLEGNLVQVAKVGRQPAPQTATDTATLTAAQMLGGLLVATPTAAAAYTTLTGALLAAALKAIHPKLQVNDTFDLVIINIGGTTDDITLTAGASGMSIVGDAVVRPSADSATEQAGQGVFRFRYSAADTFIAYRVA